MVRQRTTSCTIWNATTAGSGILEACWRGTRRCWRTRPRQPRQKPRNASSMGKVQWLLSVQISEDFFLKVELFQSSLTRFIYFPGFLCAHDYLFVIEESSSERLTDWCRRSQYHGQKRTPTASGIKSQIGAFWQTFFLKKQLLLYNSPHIYYFSKKFYSGVLSSQNRRFQ